MTGLVCPKSPNAVEVRQRRITRRRRYDDEQEVMHEVNHGMQTLEELRGLGAQRLAGVVRGVGCRHLLRMVVDAHVLSRHDAASTTRRMRTTTG